MHYSICGMGNNLSARFFTKNKLVPYLHVGNEADSKSGVRRVDLDREAFPLRGKQDVEDRANDRLMDRGHSTGEQKITMFRKQ